MKKFMSVFLVSIMSLTLAAGCGKTPAETPGSAEKIGTKDNPVKVSIITKDVSPKEEDVKKLVEQIEAGLAKEEKFVKIEYLEPPAGAYAEAVPLAFRTGQISPDIIYFQGGDIPISNDGMLEDLTPYIEKSKNLKNILENHTTEKLKNYPYLLWPAAARVSTPVMRKDIADKLDSYKDVVENPTAENYEKMFKEIVDKKLAKYAITADGDLTRLDSVFNHAFGVTATVIKEDNKWVFSKATKFEKDKLEYYADLYKQGLIDPEYITKKWDAMEKSFYEGQSAFVAATAGKVIDIYNNKMIQTQGKGAELVVLPPAKGVSQGYQSVDVTKESRGFAINSQSKVKEAAFAVLDFMAGPEGMKLDKLGIKDVHYTEKDGKIVYTDKFKEWWPRFFETINKFEPQPALAEPIMAKPALNSLEEAKKYYKQDVNVIIPAELTPQWDAMRAVYKEYASDIIRGVKPISSFDEFVKKWNEAGGNEFSAYLEEKLGK
ncbi:extracellular solute-binding protein [Clostridium polynesiense]|uniref:extracellular solute-binding protein n=1 Tax=Clostridium polynesiense TaxID=1325933 RepID=UPI00058E2A8C|nr:extracellular solute-binding protein [Clostridium polynesiense]